MNSSGEHCEYVLNKAEAILKQSGWFSRHNCVPMAFGMSYEFQINISNEQYDVLVKGRLTANDIKRDFLNDIYLYKSNIKESVQSIVDSVSLQKITVGGAPMVRGYVLLTVVTWNPRGSTLVGPKLESPQIMTAPPDGSNFLKADGSAWVWGTEGTLGDNLPAALGNNAPVSFTQLSNDAPVSFTQSIGAADASDLAEALKIVEERKKNKQNQRTLNSEYGRRLLLDGKGEDPAPASGS